MDENKRQEISKARKIEMQEMQDEIKKIKMDLGDIQDMRSFVQEDLAVELDMEKGRQLQNKMKMVQDKLDSMRREDEQEEDLKRHY